MIKSLIKSLVLVLIPTLSFAGPAIRSAPSQTSQDFTGNMTVAGDLAVTGAIDGATINTGLGDFEIGQDLDTGDDVAFVGLTASTLTALNASGLRLEDDSNTLGVFVEDGGQVGIDTDSPASAFHIKSNVTGAYGQIIIQNPADDVNSNAAITAYESDGSGDLDQQLWYLGSSSSGDENVILLNRRDAELKLGTSGYIRITVLGNGNVGIGTTTPVGLLSVGAGATHALVVESGGDVGIGINNPTEALHVDGNILLTGTILGALGYIAETVEVAKPIDQSTQAWTTLMDDDDLVLTGIAADTTQHFHIQIGILQGASATAEFDYAFDFTNAATIGLDCRMFEKTGMTFQRYDTDAEEVTMDLVSSDEAMLECDGQVYFSDTGAIQFQWAQNASQAVDTKVLQYSHIEMHKEP